MEVFIMKDKIIVRRNENDIDNWLIDFYLVTKQGTYYMFSQNYTEGVYNWFKDGRSENELRQFKGWLKNKTFGKTIEKIPMYKKYVMKEIA